MGLTCSVLSDLTVVVLLLRTDPLVLALDLVEDRAVP